MRLRLGTRSSRLALWQARTVAELLGSRGVECEIVSIETRGDEIPDRPLPEIGGDGAFTERIERALRESRIDIAVHSLKDLPVEDPDELCVGAVLGREEVREVLITRNGTSLASLPAGSVVGSSSTRRQAQLLALRPDLVVRPIRGNVETRIRKVESGEYDATLLAGVGVLRLGLAEKISEWLSIDDFLPAPGQGAIAVQCRAGDGETRRLLSSVDDTALRSETEAERGFLRALGGGCSAPVGAFAQSAAGRLRLRGRVSALDGSRVVDVEDEGDDPARLVSALARRALGEGAAELIAAAGRRVPPSAPVPSAPGGLRGRRVLVTRPRDQADDLCRTAHRRRGRAPCRSPDPRLAPPGCRRARRGHREAGFLPLARLRKRQRRGVLHEKAGGAAPCRNRGPSCPGSRPSAPAPPPPWSSAASASISFPPCTPRPLLPRAWSAGTGRASPARRCSCRGHSTGAKKRQRFSAGTARAWTTSRCIAPRRTTLSARDLSLLDGGHRRDPVCQRLRRAAPGANRPTAMPA